MKSQQTEAIKKYLQEQTNDFSNRTLARQIVSENPGLFDKNEVELVRSRIRYYRAANGEFGRKYVKDPVFVRDEMKPSQYMKEFMQKGDRVAKDPWQLPADVNKVLVLSDLHIPYHHLPSIETALDYGFKEGIDCIYINGDLIDFAKISRWAKDPSMKSTAVEIDQVRDFLDGISDLGVKVVYKLGNHEDRWNRYLLDNAPELHDLDALQIASILHLDELNIELIDSKQRAKFGKLNVIHGHEFGESIFSPVNPARGLFLRAKISVLAGHNHQTSSHHENNLDGTPTACFSVGCLCDLEPEYRPFAYTKWNHGACIVSVDENGWFDVDNFRIIDGRVRG